MKNSMVAPGWHAEELKAWRSHSLEWASSGKLLLTRGRHIYEATGCETPLRRVAMFSMPWWQAVANAFRPTQRLLRLMFYNLMPLKNGLLFASFGKSIGVASDGEFRSVSGMRRACRILRGGCATMDKNDLFFGEYFNNRDRDEVFVYRLDAAARANDVAHCFSAGSIRHVHGVYRDPYTSDLWCLTGDRDRECRILRTSDYFATIDVVGAGDESWRAVSVQFTKHAIFYGTDAEFAQNHLYRIDRRTGHRDALAAINGPVYYSCRVGNDIFFGVTAELCPSQTDRCAALWCATVDGAVERVLEWRKDRWHKRYFMPGTLHFPGGSGIAGRMFYHAVGLAQADNRMFSVRRAA